MSFDFMHERAEDFRWKSEMRYKKLLDRANFRITIIATTIAVFAAIAAFWAAYEAHKARVADERPFLAVDIEQIPKYDTWNLKIVAFGKSPARSISSVCGNFPHDDQTLVPWKPDNSYTQESFPYVLPGRSISIGCTIHSGEGGMQLIFGAVYYSDEHQTQYQTPFCYDITEFTNAPSLIQTCRESHNLPELK